MSRFEVTEATEVLLNLAESQWQAELDATDEDLPSARFLQVINWCRNMIGGKTVVADHSPTFAYCVVDKSAEVPEVKALMLLSHAKRFKGGRLKMLEMRVQPKLDAASEMSSIRDLGAVLVGAIIGALGLTFEKHSADQLKVYCEGESGREFLEGLIAQIDPSALPGVQVSVSGNWLLFKKK